MSREQERVRALAQAVRANAHVLNVDIVKLAAQVLKDLDLTIPEPPVPMANVSKLPLGPYKGR